jgi:hypothetical protein
VKYVAVIPSIYQPYTDACVASCKLDNVIVVDNTVTNRGCAASWNIGVRAMYETGADWTIIMSAGVRFGKPGGLDLVEAMCLNPDALCVEADRPSRLVKYVDHFGWHLLAIHRRTFDDVGLFDENIWPAYVEDTDFHYRMKTFYGDRCDRACSPSWPRVHVDGYLESASHGVTLGEVKTDDHGQKEYYIRKWGGSCSGWGPPAPQEWDHPFNNRANPISYWPCPTACTRPGPPTPTYAIGSAWDWISQNFPKDTVSL